MKKIVLVCLSALCALSVLANREVDPVFGDTIDRSAEDFVTASVCIADPTHISDDFLGVMGHAWIRLQCPVFHLDNCFTYEGESVNDSPFRYLFNKTRMGMFRLSTEPYIEDYRKWNRAVHEYRLNLPPEVEQRLWEIMDNHTTNRLSLPHNLRRYGCSLTVVHFVEQALRPKKIEYARPSDRDLIKSPEGLVEAWSRATVDGRPLITYAGDLVEAPAPTWKDIWWDGKVFAITMAVIVALILAVAGMIRLVKRLRK